MSHPSLHHPFLPCSFMHPFIFLIPSYPSGIYSLELFRSTSSGHNFLLASKDGTLSVYVNFNLVWAAKLSTVPVQMAVSDFGGQKGLVVTLDETGRLSIGFMGTKPPLSAVPSLTSANAREVDYDRLDEEHRDLLQVERKMVPLIFSYPLHFPLLLSYVSNFIPKSILCISIYSHSSILHFPHVI